MIRLLFQSGPLAGREIATGAAEIRLGRDPAHNDVTIDDPMASARHCVLRRSPRGAYLLEDLRSTNGTYVNGRRITTEYLAPGDRFGIGATEIEVGDGRPRLLVVGGPRAGREVPVGADPISIGRAPDNDLVFDDPDVSAHHCVLVVHPTGFILQDNGSTNGSFVNGERIVRQPVDDGDVIRVGANDIRFLIDEPERTTDVHEAAGTGDAIARLVFVSGPHDGLVVPLAEGQIAIGRRPDCDVILDDPLVSAAHCALTVEGGQFLLIDVGSTNGTLVNGARIDGPTKLGPGDLIQIGASVCELQIAGGVATATGRTVMSTVIAEGAYEVTSRPKFVIGGEVVSADQVDIGRAPSCAMRLDSDFVSRVHCTIAWAGDGFYAEDRSTHGTYIGDRRIVRAKLEDGHVLRCGPHVIKVSIRGERCSLEEADAAAALAAIEIAREAQAGVAGVAAAGAGAPAAYKTVFHVAAPAAESVADRKAEFRQRAPAWRPSSDVQPNRLPAVAVAVAAATAAGLCAVLLSASDGDAALVNHPLSESHASVAFQRQARAAGLPGGCRACHSPGAGADRDKCTRCHPDHDAIRPAHAAAIGSCDTCHAEHDGAARFDASGAPSLLGAARRCTTESCHANQHADAFATSGRTPPVVLGAGPVPTFDLSQEDLHARHAVVRHRGDDVAIGCTACHAAIDTATGEFVPAPAGLSCFRCHGGGQDAVRHQCLSCHTDEHPRGELNRLPPGDPLIARASPVPSPGRSLWLGGGLAVALFAPLAAIALVLRARRRQRAEKLVAKLQQYPAEIVKRLIHSINREKCVGCSLCVQACPASVLELVDHKSTVVNFDACIQCRKCEAACAFDALRMHEADKPPPMISVPDLDTYYQSPVEGLYLIGQAAGTPQIKNASNLGRAAIQHMVKAGLRPGAGAAAGAQVDVVIVGSGPAGLSAALTARQLGLSYVVLEKQRAPAWTVRNYYHKGKEVMAEPHDVELLGPLPHWDTDREQLLAKWDELIAANGVDIRYNQDVTDVRRDGDRFAVATAGAPPQTWTGARVVLAIGTMGNPRKLGCPGDDLEKVRNALVDPDEFRGRAILVVGGTDSAIEVALALCDENRVWLSMRRAKFDRVKPANLERINAAVAAGKVTMLPSTQVSAVTATHVTLTNRNDQSTFELENDFVFAMIGGNPPTKWLQSIGVPYTEKPHAWSPPRTDELVRATQ